MLELRWGKLGKGNEMIIVAMSFSECSVFKTFSVHTKTKRRRSQIPPVRIASYNSSVLWRFNVDDRPEGVERKLRLQKNSAQCGRCITSHVLATLILLVDITIRYDTLLMCDILSHTASSLFLLFQITIFRTSSSWTHAFFCWLSFNHM